VVSGSVYLALFLYRVQGVCAASWPLSHTAEKKREITKLFKEAHIKISLRMQNIIQNSETTSTNRQVQQKWHLPNEILRLPTETHRTNRQNIALDCF
jgi:hypothetical protein